ncbi:MAG: LytTR family DNA-binding domain-containing protein [Oscillospiraceae bacterium]
MKIEVQLEPGRREPKLILVTGELDEEARRLIQRLSCAAPELLTGTRDGILEPLEERRSARHTQSSKVFAVTPRGEYTLRQRLYELEERLDPTRFVRISNSEIINLKRVRSFDLSLSGTICVRMADGSLTYVSRRYVPKIKRALGI